MSDTTRPTASPPRTVPADAAFDGILPHRADDPAFDALLAPGARLRRLATGAAWSEGPVWMPGRDCVLWSDIPNDRVLRWSARGGAAVEEAPAAFPNGHASDRRGGLLRCEHGNRRVIRIAADGTRRVVASHWRGLRLNSPNDVVVASDGAAWFTDPPYGIASDHEGHAAPSEIGACHVYRVDPVTGEVALAADGFEAPNGLAFSPDESVLYVSDTGYGLGGKNHHIVALDVEDGRRAVRPRVLAVIEPGRADGFRVDEAGRIWTSTDASIDVLAPDGRRLGRVPVPERVANCCFGGPDGRTLFVAASTSLYAIGTAVRDAAAAPFV